MSSQAWDRITILVVLVGLIVLIALRRIDAEAGLGLIGAIVGIHVGGSIVVNAQQGAISAERRKPD